MSTGENEQGLRTIVDFTRLLSVATLILHFYTFCYPAFKQWQLTATFTDQVVSNLLHLPFFKSILTAKGAALILLAVFLLGIKGKKDEKVTLKHAVTLLSTGLVLYFISELFLFIPGRTDLMAAGYMSACSTGYLLMVTGGTYLSRILKVKLLGDVFNKENETFPQEERLLENEFSINLPAQYRLKGKVRNSNINLINSFRGVLVSGSPGAGKTYYIIRNIIDQQIRKGFSMFLYDFKYDDLSKIAYNYLLKYYHNYKVPPKFYVVNFDRPMHRCNPLEPDGMQDITDATEAARTILLGLNREWTKKIGEFFVESPINFLTAVIWYLKKYKGGKYCTLPHAIELMGAD
ncbi:YWFCY domain-containing protein [Taibaiella helva]|uniref:YWFCY domain-containing protein n=1 Tax=Taibaiella helva TaxID=2301235 RepID=UPI000E595A44|nr:YWFCY domain-containing protein [Taibaiella helva]